MQCGVHTKAGWTGRVPEPAVGRSPLKQRARRPAGCSRSAARASCTYAVQPCPAPAVSQEASKTAAGPALKFSTNQQGPQPPSAQPLLACRHGGRNRLGTPPRRVSRTARFPLPADLSPASPRPFPPGASRKTRGPHSLIGNQSRSIWVRRGSRAVIPRLITTPLEMERYPRLDSAIIPPRQQLDSPWCCSQAGPRRRTRTR